MAATTSATCGELGTQRKTTSAPPATAAGPASNGWQPGFMTDLMAKDLDLALAYGVDVGVPLASTAVARQVLTAASVAGYGREDFSSLAKVVFALSAIAGDGGGEG